VFLAEGLFRSIFCYMFKNKFESVALVFSWEVEDYVVLGISGYYESHLFITQGPHL